MCPLPSFIQTNPVGTIVDPNVGRSKYDKGYTAEALGSRVDIDEYRAQQQSSLNKLGRGVFRAAGRALTSIGEGFGAVAGLGAWTLDSRDTGEFDKYINNVFTEAFKTADEEIKEYFSIYTPEAVQSGNIRANLASASFWGNEFADGVGFMLGMMAPGAALGKAGAGARLARGINATKVATTGDKLARGFDLAAATAYQTASEAAFEAGALTSELRESRKAAREKQLRGEELTPQEQRFAELTDDDIGNSGARAFLANAAILVGPNILMNKWLFDRFSTGTSATKLAEEVRAVAAGTFKAPTALEKTGNILKNVGKGVVSEGFFEEGFQMAIETAEKEGKNSLNIDTLIDTYISNLSETDTQKGILIGAILGGGMSAVGAYKENQKDQTARQKILKGLAVDTGTFINALTVDAYQRDADGNIELDDKGKPKIDPQKAAIKMQAIKAMAELNAKGADISNLTMSEMMDVGLVQAMASHFSRIEGGIELFKERMAEEINTDKVSFAGKLGLSNKATKQEQVARVIEIAEKAEKARDVAAVYSGQTGFYVAKDKASMEIFDNALAGQIEAAATMYENYKDLRMRYQLEEAALLAEENPINNNRLSELETLISEFTENLKNVKENIDELTNSKKAQEAYDEFYEKQYKKQKDIVDAATKEYSEAKKKFKEGDKLELTYKDGTKKQGTLKKSGKDWVLDIDGVDQNIGNLYAKKASGEITSIRNYTPAAPASAQKAQPPINPYDEFGEQPTGAEAQGGIKKDEDVNPDVVNVESAESVQHEEDARTRKPTIMATAGLDVEYFKMSRTTTKGKTFVNYYTTYDPATGKPKFNKNDNQDTFFDWAAIPTSGSMNDPNFEFRAFIYENKDTDPVAAELYSMATSFDTQDGRDNLSGAITNPANVTIKLVAFRNGEPVRHNGKLVYTPMHSQAFVDKTMSDPVEEDAFLSWRAEIIKQLAAGKSVSLRPASKSAGHPIYEAPVISGTSAKRVRMPLAGRVYPEGKSHELTLTVAKSVGKTSTPSVNIGGVAVPVGVDGAVYTVIMGANGSPVPVRLMTSNLTEDQARTVLGLVYFGYPPGGAPIQEYLQIGNKKHRIISSKDEVGLLNKIVSVGEGASVNVESGMLVLSTGYSIKIAEIPANLDKVISEMQKLHFNVSEKLLGKTVEMPVFSDSFFVPATAPAETAERKKQSAQAKKLSVETVKYNQYLDSKGILKTDLVPMSERQLAQVYWTFDTNILNAYKPKRATQNTKIPAVPATSVEPDFEAAYAEPTDDEAAVLEELEAERAKMAEVNNSTAEEPPVETGEAITVTETDEIQLTKEIEPEDVADEIIAQLSKSAIDTAMTMEVPEQSEEEPSGGLKITPVKKASAVAPAQQQAPPVTRIRRSQKTSVAEIKLALGKLGISKESIENYERLFSKIQAGQDADSIANTIMENNC